MTVCSFNVKIGTFKLNDENNIKDDKGKYLQFIDVCTKS